MQQPQWRCYYYGRPTDKWNADLPTGISGVVESDDGLNWTRVRGLLEEGAVLRGNTRDMQKSLHGMQQGQGKMRMN